MNYISNITKYTDAHIAYTAALVTYTAAPVTYTAALLTQPLFRKSPLTQPLSVYDGNVYKHVVFTNVDYTVFRLYLMHKTMSHVQHAIDNSYSALILYRYWFITLRSVLFCHLHSRSFGSN